MFGGNGAGGAKLAEIAVICGLVAATGYLGNLLHHNYVVHGAASVEGLPTAPVTLPAQSLDGVSTELRLDDPSQPTVLFVLSTTCPFCEDNMPQWRQLASRLRDLGSNAPRPVVISVSSAEETRAFLDFHQLDVPARIVDPAILPLLGLTGYPSTVAVDPTNRGLAAWSGVLSDGAHAAVEAWAQGAKATASSSPAVVSTAGG